MLDRRQFTGLLAAAAACPAGAQAQAQSIPFYSSVGCDLVVYGLDVAAGTLTRKSTVQTQANVQYAWPHPSRKFLYAASSSQGNAGPPVNSVSVFSVAGDGALTPLGAAQPLKLRPINMSVTHNGAFALIAYNEPSRMTVHRLNSDGTIGEEVAQPSGLDFGIYAHQVRSTPDDKTVIMVTRGVNAEAGKPEQPGALEVFKFDGGRLSPLQSLTPTGSHGIGFGPRHLDFHPTLPFVYVSLERNNRLDVYGLNRDGSLSDQALFKKNTLSDPSKFRGVGPSAIHVHPNGRFVYVPNRGSNPVDFEGKKISNGGPENIAVFAIDRKTGEPTLIEEIEAHGFVLRTFAIDPSGTLMVAASQNAMMVRDGDKLDNVSAGLSVYRIGGDGKLTFLRKTEVDTAAGRQFWCGLLTMA